MTTSNAVVAARNFLIRYQRSTRRVYKLDLKRYFRWCAAQRLDPLQVTRVDFDRYVAQLNREPLAAATKARFIGTVMGYYKLAQIDNFITKDPTIGVRRIKVPKDSPVLGLTYLEFARYLNEASKLGPQAHALVLLMGMMGLRVSEVCAIQIQDFREDRGHRLLSIVGKGSKPAVCPIPIPVWQVLQELIGDRQSGPLFKNKYQLDMTPINVRRILNRVTKACGITKRITPHSLRHTYITQLLDAGIPLRDVQIGARHADPRTTLRYDRSREQIDKHANYSLAIRMAGNVD